MIVVGLTGSIGMGKSTVAAMFLAQNIPVFDADAVVHQLQGPGGLLVDAIELSFPGTTSAHGVDRVALGARVFSDVDALHRLESIVHPAVAAQRQLFFETHKRAAMVVLDIPLLFEKGRPKNIDAVVVVSANAAIQRDRVLARPGMTAKKFNLILSQQMPDADKRERADYIIETTATLATTEAQVRAVIACLSQSKGSSLPRNA